MHKGPWQAQPRTCNVTSPGSEGGVQRGGRPGAAGARVRVAHADLLAGTQDGGGPQRRGGRGDARLPQRTRSVLLVKIFISLQATIIPHQECLHWSSQPQCAGSVLSTVCDVCQHPLCVRVSHDAHVTLPAPLQHCLRMCGTCAPCEVPSDAAAPVAAAPVLLQG